ncbi:hypothetical protein BACCIP111883_02338 [Sutcliffiella rhizosphaerae]|uniref:Uncharacterized protein n=1 Tax=Sutcliffiella rhizosphaerae TaxID=2880967 RepID=A0ABM8YNK2_9BACI|nr:hypothetical protein BACCIP111883_02338 [Sutcliffiella rhizosphaerae]
MFCKNSFTELVFAYYDTEYPVKKVHHINSGVFFLLTFLMISLKEEISPFINFPNTIYLHTNQLSL